MDHLQNVLSYFDQQQPLCAEHDRIPKDLYREFGVKAGLRDETGKGVLAGLTNISDIRAFQYVDGVKHPADGQLLYRGYDVKDLINGSRGSRFAFEEAGYLLLFGQLPTPEQLEQFCAVLGECRTMPTNFTRDVIMKAPSHDIMNSMARSVLTLASYDPKAADLDTANVLRQSIQLAGIFPMLAVYSYHAYNHYEKDASMYIHRPDPSLSTAENFLRMLRPDMQYTPLEARVLDVALLLHAEHGGGNNSTFTTRVVTSSGTDTYSAMAAALCSLKGPRHGGANLMVMHMMQNIRDNLHDIEDDEELEAYLKKLLHGEAFDRKGLIYGMGHAVYSLSDPREVVFKGYVEQLAHEKGRDKELSLYTRIERMAPQLIAQERKIFKGVSPNVDFYSGFVYEMLGIPMELYTPLFAVARVMGWSAHRIEELLSANKIIRPAYKSLGGTHDYFPRSQRASREGIGMEEMQQHQGEWFFLHELNVDKVFSTIQRADYLILYYIKVAQEKHPGEKLYLADLAAAMGLRVTELSKGIEKLQDSGFVTWKTDREAGRTYVELSSKAVELMAEEQALLQRCYRRMRAELGDEELRRAAATMQRATAILKEEREKEFPAAQ